MIFTSPSAVSEDLAATRAGDNMLRLSSEPDPDSNIGAASSAVYSSIHQSAVALVSVASEQANQSSTRTSVEQPCRPRQLMDERREHAIQRASAEQARRFAECTRATLEAVLRHSLQPCFALDESNRLIRWNAGMERLTGVTESDAIGQSLSLIFAEDNSTAIEAANSIARSAALDDDSGVAPMRIVESKFSLGGDLVPVQLSLLPMCRLPRVVELVLVLVTPEPATLI